jgi:hypothetical protein
MKRLGLLFIWTLFLVTKAFSQNQLPPFYEITKDTSLLFQINFIMTQLKRLIILYILTGFGFG